MTSTVKVTAHCASTKHVQLRVYQALGAMQDDSISEEIYLNDGESKEVYIYDNRYVLTRELDK